MDIFGGDLNDKEGLGGGIGQRRVKALYNFKEAITFFGNISFC
jgi:hypothetical protein